MARGAAAALVAVALIAAATACSGGDKAVGPAQKPITLTLAKHDVDYLLAMLIKPFRRA